MSSISYNTIPDDEVKTPILTSIYRLIGVLCIILGVLAGIVGAQDSRGLPAAIGAVAICVFAALTCFGITQVIMLIAKIECNTRSQDRSYEMLKSLREIATNTAPKS